MTWERLVRYARIALRLLFVPKCVVCEERMPPDSEMVLCPICRTKYENEKTQTCPTCAARMGECLCLPKRMEHRGIKRMAKLFPYEPERCETSARVIYALKHHNLRLLHLFLGKELAEPLRGILEEGDFIVTYPPRSRYGVRHDGFDHAEELSRALAKELGLPHVRTLSRKRHRVQKRLSHTERLEAAAATYALRRGVDLSGKRVILVDDVCTSGATLIAAARLLRSAGAQEVVCATLALTPQKAQMKPRPRNF